MRRRGWCGSGRSRSTRPRWLATPLWAPTARYAGLQALAREILEEAAEIDAAEDELYGEKRGDELPDDLADPTTRPARIRQLLDEIEAERQALQDEHDAKRAARAERQAQTGRAPRGRPMGDRAPQSQTDALFSKKHNVTDPDSAIVSHRGMLIQGYNVHAAVADGQVILAVEASSQANEHGRLEAMLDAAKDNVVAAGIPDQIERLLADSGYWHADQVTKLTDQGLDVLVCPRPYKPTSKNNSVDPVAKAMAQRLADPDNATLYRQRAQIAEPVFAHIKHLRGITRLLRRGRQAVQGEVDLIATTHNLLKLYRYSPQTA